MTRYAIYGSAGCGRGVMPFLRNQRVDDDCDFIFVDDDPSRQFIVIDGIECISFEELVSGDIESTRICVAVAQADVRRRLTEKCRRAHLEFFDAVADSHTRYGEVEVGPGSIFCANTVVTTNVRIGAHFHCNIFSYVEHDSLIGDFVTFAPRVSCNGNTVIEDGAYIGAGAVLRQGSHGRPLRVGEGAVVGMGSVVIRDVAPGTTVAGNPAKAVR